MKYSVAALAFAAAASAQQLSDIPACAIPAIDAARQSITDCAIDDFTCICENITELTAAAAADVIVACGAAATIGEVQPAVEEFCRKVHENPAPTSEPAPTSTVTVTSEVTSEPEPTSTSTVTVTSEVTSEPEPTATVTKEVPSSYPTITTSYSTATPAPTGGNSSTPTSSEPIPTAGAAIVGSIGSFAMLALGALAAF